MAEIKWRSTAEELPVGDEVPCLVIVSGRPVKHVELRRAYELADYYPTPGGGQWVLQCWPEWEHPMVHAFIPLDSFPDPEEF